MDYQMNEQGTQMLPPGGTYVPTYSPPYGPPLGKSSYHPLAGTETEHDPMYDDPPTPEELEEMNKPFIPRDWYKQRKFQIAAVGIIIGLVFTILFAVFHQKIENALVPFAKWMKDLKGGWAIPIAIMIVISFPPLQGHELVALLVGDVWGLGVGFAIVAAGTLLGELACFFVFKYWCTGRAEKVERKSLFYGCLAQAIRKGGFKMALLARLSVIPSHFTTAICSTCGISFWIYALAAVASLPKQLGTVSVGALLSSTSSSSKTLNTVLLVISTIITIISLRYIRKAISEQKLYVIRERKARMGVV